MERLHKFCTRYFDTVYYKASDYLILYTDKLYPFYFETHYIVSLNNAQMLKKGDYGAGAQKSVFHCLNESNHEATSTYYLFGSLFRNLQSPKPLINCAL